MIRPDQLRAALRLWASGVTLVTVEHDDHRHGMTVSSFSSVSLEPPLVSVHIERRTRTHGLIQASGAFAVCILSGDQQHLAERFGGGISDEAERFSGLDYSLSELGNPIPDGCLVAFDCRVAAAHPAGTHTVFIGEVSHIHDSGQTTPLIYFNRNYRKLEDAS